MTLFQCFTSDSNLYFLTENGGGGCVFPLCVSGQLLSFCLFAIFFEPGFIYFLCNEVFHVFFVFAFRWFRVFHRGCVYFPIVFSSNSLCIHIYIYFMYIVSLYSGFFALCWVISLGCRPQIDRPAHTLYIYRIV